MDAVFCAFRLVEKQKIATTVHAPRRMNAQVFCKMPPAATTGLKVSTFLIERSF
jgi:hypothetical protein